MKNITKLSIALGSAAILLSSVASGAFAANMPRYAWGKTMWQSVPNATSYNIYYKASTDKMWTHSVIRLPSNATSYNIMALKPGVTYWYMVAARKDGKEIWFGTPTKLPTWMTK